MTARRLLAVGWVFALAMPLYGEVIRRVQVKPTTPEEDARANDPAVPEVLALSSQFQRVVIVRLKFQARLLEGLMQAVQQERIRNGVILAGAGSVRGYHVHAVSNRDFPSENLFVQDPACPADIVSMNGYILDGRVHAHITLATGDRAFGGHLEPGTEVFTFAIVTIGVLPDELDLRRLDDKTYR